MTPGPGRSLPRLTLVAAAALLVSSCASVPVSVDENCAQASCDGPATSSSPAHNDAQEVVFWKAVEDSSEPLLFSEYLRRFPQGRFAQIARERGGQDPGADPPVPPQTTVLGAGVGAGLGALLGNSSSSIVGGLIGGATRVDTWAGLPAMGAERPGFGLYTYVLMNRDLREARHLHPGAMRRLRALLVAIAGSTKRADELPDFPVRELNVFYIPHRETRPQLESLVDGYDSTLSLRLVANMMWSAVQSGEQELLQHLARQPGPFLISTDRLVHASTPGTVNILYCDLSGMSPAGMGEVVAAYKARIAAAAPPSPNAGSGNSAPALPAMSLQAMQAPIASNAMTATPRVASDAEGLGADAGAAMPSRRSSMRVEEFEPLRLKLLQVLLHAQDSLRVLTTTVEEWL